MNSAFKTVVFAVGFLAFTATFAGEQTATLTVNGMTCASCPYIVKQSLADVDGVMDVKVSLADKSAVVTFDDTKTEVDALTLATTNVGFPSTLKE